MADCSSSAHTSTTGAPGPVAEGSESGAAEAPEPTVYLDLLNSTAALSDLPVYADSRVELLIDGPQTYAAMLAAIEAAHNFIHIETYILADDEIGQKFADALIVKSTSGVAVRLIFDSIGSWSSSRAYFQQLRDAGVEVLEFHDINPFSGGNPLNANVRDHRKIFVVDGRVAFTGGVNFSRTYTSRPKRFKSIRKQVQSGWRDTHVALYGPVVAGVEQVFEETWQQRPDAGETPFSASFPPPQKAGDDTIAVLAPEGGDDDESEIYRAYLDAMNKAQQRIWITQAYFGPDETFLNALTSAAGRGVDVQIILPGISDSLLLQHLSRTYYGELLTHGVQVYETTSAVLHAKTAVIDGIWSTVGTSNLDPRSFWHNHEINVVVFGNDFARQMEDQFRSDIACCNPVSMDDWHSRPWTGRAIGAISRLFSHWL